MPIHPNWFNNTCVIFRRKTNEKKEIIELFKDASIKGTGFFISYLGKKILVTAKHVIEGKDKLGYGYYWKNSNSETILEAKDFEALHQHYNIEWYFHDNSKIDLAVSIVELLHEFPLFDVSNMIPYSELNRGSDVYYLGYPLSIISKDDITPIVKKGIIARKIDKYTEFYNDFVFQEKTILVDGYFDEGNSGSPIIQGRGIQPHDYPGFPKLPPNREGLIGIAIRQYNVEINKEWETTDKIGDKFIKQDIYQTFQTYGLGICLSNDYLFDIFKTKKMQKQFKIE